MKKIKIELSERGICHVCLQPIINKDGSDETHECDVCGREGFCEYCSKPGNHDCE